MIALHFSAAAAAAEVNHLLINKNERSLLWWLGCLVPFFGRYVRGDIDNWNVLHVAELTSLGAKDNDLCGSWWEGGRTASTSDRWGLLDGRSTQKDHIHARDPAKEPTRSQEHPHKIVDERLVACAGLWPIEAVFEGGGFACLWDWLAGYVDQDTSELRRESELARCGPGDKSW